MISTMISPALLSRIVRNGGVDEEISRELLRAGLSADLVAKLEDFDFMID